MAQISYGQRWRAAEQDLPFGLSRLRHSVPRDAGQVRGLRVLKPVNASVPGAPVPGERFPPALDIMAAGGRAGLRRQRCRSRR